MSNKTPRSHEVLVALYKYLSRALADETLPEFERNALREQFNGVREELDEIEGRFAETKEVK